MVLGITLPKNIVYSMLACCLCGSSYPRPVAPRHCILIIFYALCPCWIVLSWLCVVHLCSGRTLINSQKVCLYVTGYSRGRSDLRKGCILQRLPGLITMHHRLVTFFSLPPFAEHYISFFVFIPLFCTRLRVVLSVCFSVSLPSRHTEVSKLMGN